jgi:hypothetical protein
MAERVGLVRCVLWSGCGTMCSLVRLWYDVFSGQAAAVAINGCQLCSSCMVLYVYQGPCIIW